MGSFIENLFYISLAITFVLILFMFYHFKQRISSLEQKTETMFSIVNSVVKELGNIRSFITRDLTQERVELPIKLPILREHSVYVNDKVGEVCEEEDDDDDDDEDDEDDEDDDDEDEIERNEEDDKIEILDIDTTYDLKDEDIKEEEIKEIELNEQIKTDEIEIIEQPLAVSIDESKELAELAEGSRPQAVRSDSSNRIEFQAASEHQAQRTAGH